MTATDASLLVFRLGRLLLAVPALDSAGILMTPAHITHPPGARPGEGLFHHGSETVVLTDLRLRLDLPAAGAGRVILTRAAGPGLRGILVDEVTGILRREEVQAAPLPAELPRRLFPQALLHRDGLVLVTGFAALLTLEPGHAPLRELAAPEPPATPQAAAPEPPAPKPAPVPPPPTRSHTPLDQALRSAAEHVRSPEPPPARRRPAPARPAAPKPRPTPPAPATPVATTPPATAPAQAIATPEPPPLAPPRREPVHAGRGLAALALATVAGAGTLLWLLQPPAPPITAPPSITTPPPVSAPSSPVPTVAAPPVTVPAPAATVTAAPVAPTPSTPRIEVTRAPQGLTVLVEEPAPAPPPQEQPDEPVQEPPPAAAAPAETGTAPPAQERVVIHTVVRGDTLWAIATRYIQNPLAYRELARQSAIEDPNLIYPGDQVRIIFRRSR